MATPKSPTPSWWNPSPKAGGLDQYALTANALLPYLSPEDQRQVGQFLGNKYKGLENYNTVPYGKAPSTITPELRNQYLSSGRATEVLSTLNNMLTASNKTPATAGAGYNFLSNIVGTLQRLGGQGSAMSRADYQEFTNSVNNLLASSKGNSQLAPWANLANYIVNPTFSAGPLVNQKQTTTGRTIYGQPNTKLFT